MSFHLYLRLLFPLSGIYVNLFKNPAIHQTHILFFTGAIDTLVQKAKGSKIFSVLLLFSSSVKNSSMNPGTLSFIRGEK